MQENVQETNVEMAMKSRDNSKLTINEVDNPPDADIQKEGGADDKKA